jgi:hypothetical protein
LGWHFNCHPNTTAGIFFTTRPELAGPRFPLFITLGRVHQRHGRRAMNFLAWKFTRLYWQQGCWTVIPPPQGSQQGSTTHCCAGGAFRSGWKREFQA